MADRNYTILFPIGTTDGLSNVENEQILSSFLDQANAISVYRVVSHVAHRFDLYTMQKSILELNVLYHHLLRLFQTHSKVWKNTIHRLETNN